MDERENVTSRSPLLLHPSRSTPRIAPHMPRRGPEERFVACGLTHIVIVGTVNDNPVENRLGQPPPLVFGRLRPRPAQNGATVIDRPNMRIY